MRRLLVDDTAEVKPVARIDVTNLIDVTMTLLVLFILIAPVIDQGFSLQLPQAQPRTIRSDNSLNIVIARDGRVFLEGKDVSLQDLAERAAAAAAKRDDPDVVILADRALEYGRVIQVMDVIRRVGLTRLALATSEGG